MRKTLNALLLTTTIFFGANGCREIPTTPEAEFTKERIRLERFIPVSVDTKNGDFNVVYVKRKSGGLFNEDSGILLIMHLPDSTWKNYEVNVTDKKMLWFSKNGVTKDYSENDPSLVLRYIGKFVCEAYLIKQ
ncbi:MAG: hypothetical protein Q8Q04_01240 [archaeon]|nr:hypothetical protein [archaeon]